MTRIVLDGLPLFVRSAGVARYTAEIARRIAQLAPATQFTLLGPPLVRPKTPLQHPPANLDVHQTWRYPFAMDQPLAGLPKIFSAADAAGPHDLFHATSYLGPARRSEPLVLTVHDLALARCPQWGTNSLQRVVARAIEQISGADRIIADSEATRRDVVELCGVPAERVHVTHLGVDDAFRPLDPARCRAELEKRLGTSGPFVLHVGTLEPRKNLPRLITAFTRARQLAGTGHTLLLAGETGWGAEPIFSAARGAEHRGHVRLLGRVADAQLPELYCASEVFAYPSLYEGFGLPVLEAMACATAAVTSNSSSLPELVGNTAMLVDPDSEVQIAEALAELMADGVKRETLASAGRARAAEFTWERTAGETLAVYADLLGRRLN